MKKLLALLFALLATPAAAQTIPSGPNGSMNYWGVGGLSQVLNPGLAGQCLTTQGVGSAPVWVNCQVSSLSLLPPINTNQFYGNVSGNFAPPIGVDVNTILNTVGYDIARPPPVESILYKSNVGPAFNWQALPPGTTGSLLTSGGPTNPPFWAPTATQANLASICQTVGALLYFDTPSLLWKCLAPGTSGQLLQTGGASGNPSWLTVTLATLGGVPSTRNINTSTPLGGGGPLSSDLTLTCATCATTTGSNTYTGDNLFASGRPWCDVRAKGAVGNSSTDDHAAILACYNQLVTNFGGGIIYFPPSNGAYCDKTGLIYASSGIILQGSEGSNGASQISACGADVTPVTLNGFTNIIDRMSIVGSPIVTTTKPALVLGTGCTECIVSQTRVSGGLNALDIQAFDFHISDIHAESAYGSAIVRVRGGGYLTRTKLDQLYPNGTVPAYGTVISAWTPTHAYAQGTVVSDGGFYIQATIGGTSGSSLPTLASYSTPIVDGTVTWKLLAPTTYYSLQFDTGSTSSYEIFGDHTGPFTAGVAITNTLAGAAPQAINIDHAVTGQVFQAGVLATAGNDFTVSNSQMDGCILTSCAGVQMSGSWIGDALIIGNSMWSNGIGVSVSTGQNWQVVGNQIVGNFVGGVTVSANLNNFSIVGNNLGSSPTFGANVNAVVVAAGTSDNYNITGNNVRGSVSGITDSGTGTHKFVGGNEGPLANANLANPATTVAGQTCTLGSTCGFSSFTNILGADVALNNTANYFDGPSTANGLVGTYFASGTVQIGSSTANDQIICKLWDGTTVFQEASFLVPTNSHYTLSLSGIFTTPAANVRISCRDAGSINGSIFHDSGLGTNKASALTTIRIN